MQLATTVECAMSTLSSSSTQQHSFFQGHPNANNESERQTQNLRSQMNQNLFLCAKVTNTQQLLGQISFGTHRKQGTEQNNGFETNASGTTSPRSLFTGHALHREISSNLVRTLGSLYISTRGKHLPRGSCYCYTVRKRATESSNQSQDGRSCSSSHSATVAMAPIPRSRHTTCFSDSLQRRAGPV